MKNRKKKTHLFRRDNAAKFEAYAAFKTLNLRTPKKERLPTAKIARYLDVGATTLRRWSTESPFKEKLAKQCKAFENRIENRASTAEAVKKLRVDCGIRHLLRDKSVRFLRDLSVFLDTDTAAATDSEGNGESVTVREAIRTAAKTVGLNDKDFLEVLLHRLQASDGKP